MIRQIANAENVVWIEISIRSLFTIFEITLVALGCSRKNFLPL
jgi:hypothetical protein